MSKEEVTLRWLILSQACVIYTTFAIPKRWLLKSNHLLKQLLWKEVFEWLMISLDYFV